MGIFQKLFSKNEPPQTPIGEFWNFFLRHEKKFHTVVKNRGDYINEFFNLVNPQLDKIREGIYLLAGMCDDHTVELILTPDGVVKNIAIVEDIIAAAPSLPNWKFTAMKPAIGTEGAVIKMYGHEFGSNTLSFFANEHPEFPDEVDLVIVHRDFKKEDHDVLLNGILIYLDNAIGEMNFVTLVDGISVCGPGQAPGEVIPITKLREYLTWREKEFDDKYVNVRHDTSGDEFLSGQATTEKGNPLFIVLDKTLIEWDAKPSHPWALTVSVSYDGSKNQGLPDDKAAEFMHALEEEIGRELKDQEGYLYLGRLTGENLREIFIACTEFRHCSRVIASLLEKHRPAHKVEYSIYKDKYWRSMDRFAPS